MLISLCATTHIPYSWESSVIIAILVTKGRASYWCYIWLLSRLKCLLICDQRNSQYGRLEYYEELNLAPENDLEIIFDIYCGSNAVVSLFRKSKMKCIIESQFLFLLSFVTSTHGMKCWEAQRKSKG